MIVTSEELVVRDEGALFFFRGPAISPDVEPLNASAFELTGRTTFSTLFTLFTNTISTMNSAFTKEKMLSATQLREHTTNGDLWILIAGKGE